MRRLRRGRLRMANRYIKDYLDDPENRQKDPGEIAAVVGEQLEEDFGFSADWLTLLIPLIKMILELFPDDDD